MGKPEVADGGMRYESAISYGGGRLKPGTATLVLAY